MNPNKHQHRMTRFVATYKDLFGLIVTNPRGYIEGELKKYSLLAVLEFCSKLSLILYKDDGLFNQQTQLKLLTTIFKDQADILQQAEIWHKRQGINVYFADTQIVTLLEIALQVCPLSGAEDIDEQNISQMGKLLLLAEDANSKAVIEIGSSMLSDEHKKDAVLKYMHRQFYGRSMSLAGAEVEFQRSREIFKLAATISPQIAADFQKASGMSFEEYELFSFSLFPKNLISYSPFDLDKDWFIDERTYLSKTDLDATKFKRYLDKISLPAEQYQQIASGNGDFLKTLSERPLINQDNLYVPLSIHHYIRQMGDNIYWTLYHFYEQQGQLNKFSEVWGKAFEQYAQALCRQIDSGADKFFYAPRGKTRKQEGADGKIEVSDAVVLFEFKVGKLPIGTLLQPTGKELKKYFKRTFAGMQIDIKKRKGFGQLLHTARMIKNGDIPAVEPNKTIFMVVVLQQPLPGDAFSRLLIKELLGEVTPWPKDVYPVFVNVRDLETMTGHYTGSTEAFVKTLAAFHDYQWDTTADNFYADFRNFMFITEGKILRNETLAETFLKDFEKLASHIKKESQ